MVEITQLGNEQAYNYATTIGATSIILSQKKHRKSYCLRNISAGGQVISLSFSNETPAIAGSGIVLNVNDALTDSNSGTYKVWSGDIYAVSSAAGGILAVNEVI